MNMQEQLLRLDAFRVKNKVTSKGSLALIVFLSRAVQAKPFPLSADMFLTGNKGQVAGASMAAVQAVLRDHGLMRTLAKEGGRTSRGSIGLMTEYVDLLNALQSEGALDLTAAESWWADRVKDFFASQPFTLHNDASRTLRAVVDDLFEQAVQRQKENPGTTYVGTMLQHLTAAKLSLVMPDGALQLHGASVADAPTSRNGDFVLQDVIIHCTTAPVSALIDKCRENLAASCFPVIVTVYERVNTALTLAADAGLEDRIEVWDIGQFISANVYEHSLFSHANRGVTLARLVEQYNAIIERCETDMSLKIKMA